ncbi:MAG: hypothetical protein ACE5EH_10850 [Gammaproteobacteria bacterium]
MAPEKAGMSKFELIAPTVEVAFFPMNRASEEELHDLIKDALYIPSKDSKKDMFRIAAHGLIF